MNTKRLLYIILPIYFVSMFFFYNYAIAEELTSSSFIIRNPAIDIGGGTSTSDSFQMREWIGQLTPGISTSTNFNLNSGSGYTPDSVFTVSSPSSLDYGSIAISTNAQDANATLAGVTITNTRAVSTSWSLTVASTNLTRVGASTKLFGNNNTVSFSGSYTGVLAPNSAGIYTVEITSGGARGDAIFKLTDPAGVITANITTAPSVSLGSGISVNFGVATYAIFDKWILRVDSIGYNNLNITPGTPVVSYGDTGVTIGLQGIFFGSGAISDARTLMSGSEGNGVGEYVQDSALIQTIHANTLQGTFDGTIIITLS